MSRSSRFGHQRSYSPRRKALGILSNRQPRKRKTFTFERLEDRYAFSVATSPLDYQSVSYSNDTAQGADAILQQELYWSLLQQAGGGGGSAGTTEHELASRALPTDPLFQFQWHLLNVAQEVGNPDFQNVFGIAGEDANVVPAWNAGYTGEGVVVAVLDSGVQLIHPDLTANIHPTLRFNAITGTNNPNPGLTEPGGAHGTAVAGLIGASNNGQGGVGVAPGVQMIPIKMLGGGSTDLSTLAALQYAVQNGADITSNSWGPPDTRTAFQFALNGDPFINAQILQTLRDSVIFGRDGLGVIHVFAAGNGAGPTFSPGFESFGNYDSSTYDPFISSRYIIGVTGVDHDGMYANFLQNGIADGTFTPYAEISAAVLVAAPTGSNFAQNIGDDTGQGSGIFTTDILGDFGFNAAPVGGFDFDRDFLEDPDYTSRFNGTSASAPIVSGVIALMLDANPNLTYRDVQEILVRSSRQNAQFETPQSGGGLISQNTWQTNQIGPFRDPDLWEFLDPPQDPFLSVIFPFADPNHIPGLGRQLSHYESQPALFTNAAGYTVSQGYGVYAEQIGYAHGVIDAGLAVKMAEQWHTLGQNINRQTERTFTTFVLQPGWNLPAAEKMDEDGTPAMIVPGGIGGQGGFIDYWNEYFAEDDPDDLEDGPFSGDDPPGNSRGLSYLEFVVPETQAMNVEWVEVKVDIAGPASDLDFLRIMLTSPEGTQSELNHFYADPDIPPAVFSFQPISTPAGAIDPAGDIDINGGSFVWTFSTNRNWGERSGTATIIDPITGEPQLQSFLGTDGAPIQRNWELHIENWGTEDYVLSGLEVIWHGKPIAVGTQRVQGLVGIDTQGEGEPGYKDFNYNRTIQTLFDSDLDPLTVRLGDLQRTLDLTQEPFAENILVEAFRVVNGDPEEDAVARFLTGADGNYYFDLVPGDYVIRATDPLGREFAVDDVTDPMFRRHFQQEWRISEDWFFAADRDDPDPSGAIGDILWDDVLDAPVKFEDGNGANVPMGVKELNFLIQDEAPPNQIVVSGTVFADLNGNGVNDGDDTPAGGIFVYFDANRNNVHDAGEQQVATSDDPATRGQYSLTIPADAIGRFQIGIIPPSATWIPTNPASSVLEVFAEPGDIINNVNFFIDPPNDSGGGTPGEPGNILGIVYNDRNLNGVRNPGEEGVIGFRVFVDANENGLFDAGEIQSITSSNGSFFLTDVAPGLIRIDVQETESWGLISPAAGFRQVQLGAGGTVTGVLFGLDNLADRDWGDLPNSYGTLNGNGGPSHFVIRDPVSGLPTFMLGTKIDGETDGKPTADATGDDVFGQDDDGIVILSNGGQLRQGVNTLRVTVAGIGGLLNGWIDWNSNGQFDANEHLTWQNPQGNFVTQVDLNPGTWNLNVTAPANMAGGPLAARFRWGEANLGSGGPANFGEVEDYILPSSVPIILPGDFDGSGSVDQSDLNVWRATFGSTTDLRADANSDSIVDLADWVVWKNNLGAGTGAGALAGGAQVAAPPLPPVLAPKVFNANFGTAPGLQQWLQESGFLSRLQAAGFHQRIFGTQSVAGGGGGGLGGGATIVPHGPSVTSPTVVDSVIDVGSSRFTASLNILSTNVATASARPVVESSAIGGISDSSLLLADLAWAALDAGDAGDDLEVGRLHDENDDSVSELTLATLFEEEDNWWHAI